MTQGTWESAPSNGRQRVVCLGELLWRFGAPGREVLLQSPRLEVSLGGAEANVAIALAQFGHATAMISVVPDNPLGRAARGELQRHGVDASQVRTGNGRMGLYFLESGAMQRPSEVLYDRAGSAFAQAAPQDFDWPSLLAGARLLHLSGITPALGAASAALALDAARAAREQDIGVVFDGNYRQKLWESSGGNAPVILRGIVEHAVILFADHRDLGVILGVDSTGLEPDAAAANAAQAAFAAFPHLSHIASTQRIAHSVDRQQLAALMFTRDQRYACAPMPIDGVVDRIGGGDAFAAGVLHGLLGGAGEEQSLHFGLAAACLKHSLPGDFVRFGIAAVESLLRAERIDVRR